MLVVMIICCAVGCIGCSVACSHACHYACIAVVAVSFSAVIVVARSPNRSAQPLFDLRLGTAIVLAGKCGLSQAADKFACWRSEGQEGTTPPSLVVSFNGIPRFIPDTLGQPLLSTKLAYL